MRRRARVRSGRIWCAAARRGACPQRELVSLYAGVWVYKAALSAAERLDHPVGVVAGLRILGGLAVGRELAVIVTQLAGRAGEHVPRLARVAQALGQRLLGGGLGG